MTRPAFFLILMLGGQPAVAQSFDESVALIENTMRYEGPALASGITFLSVEIADDCTIQIKGVGQMDGVEGMVQQRGSLVGLDVDDISLEQNANGTSLRFRTTANRNQWDVNMSIANNNAMYDALRADPDAMFPLAASCDTEGCNLTMAETGGTTTRSHQSILISEFVDDADHALLLSSFHNLSALCAASAQ